MRVNGSVFHTQLSPEEMDAIDQLFAKQVAALKEGRYLFQLMPVDELRSALQKKGIFLSIEEAMEIQGGPTLAEQANKEAENLIGHIELNTLTPTMSKVLAAHLRKELAAGAGRFGMRLFGIAKPNRDQSKTVQDEAAMLAYSDVIHAGGDGEAALRSAYDAYWEISSSSSTHEEDFAKPCLGRFSNSAIQRMQAVVASLARSGTLPKRPPGRPRKSK